MGNIRHSDISSSFSNCTARLKQKCTDLPLLLHVLYTVTLDIRYVSIRSTHHSAGPPSWVDDPEWAHVLREWVSLAPLSRIPSTARSAPRTPSGPVWLAGLWRARLPGANQQGCAISSESLARYTLSKEIVSANTNHWSLKCLFTWRIRRTDFTTGAEVISRSCSSVVTIVFRSPCPGSVNSPVLWQWHWKLCKPSMISVDKFKHVAHTHTHTHAHTDAHISVITQVI